MPFGSVCLRRAPPAGRRRRPALWAALALVPAAALAQGGGSAGTAPDWVRACNADACRVSRAATDTGSGRAMVNFSVILYRDRPEAKLLALVPLGIAIGRGVLVGRERDMRAVPIAACVPEGCLAEIVVDAGAVALLQAQEDLALHFFAYGTDEAFRVTVPLDGLAAALGAARAELGG